MSALQALLKHYREIYGEGDVYRAAAAELEAMGSDTARLDWLEQRRQSLNSHYGTSYGWEVVMNHNVNRAFVRDCNTLDINDAAANGTDIRRAIDATRKEIR